MEGKPALAALLAVQRDLKAPKGQRNTFGKYNYRSAEDILEAVKPHLAEHGLVLLLSDSIEQVCDRCYVKATATVLDVATGDTVQNAAYAREPLTKKGMDEPQITGTCSSYARKYALNGLIAIDDTKDPDTDEYRNEAQGRAGAPKTSNANKNPRAGGNAPQTGTQAATGASAAYADAIRHLNAEISRTGTDSKTVKAIAKAQLGKESTRDMTPEQVEILAANLETWLAAAAGA